MTRRPAERRRSPAAGEGTAGQWLAAAERAYRGAGAALGQTAAHAHDEALYLLLRTLGLGLDAPSSVLERRLTPGERRRLDGILRRRLGDRVPAAYLTREAWLAGHRFHVDERVIVPRSYFVELIPDGLTALLPRGVPVRHAADACTGSGCLALLLAHAFPGAEVDATDLSAAALEVAAINVREHRLGHRVRLHHGDALDALPARRYDLLISNPPYEPSGHVDRQEPEFRAEPRLAHDGGPDGLDVVRRLIRGAASRLSPRGVLVIEVGGLRRAVTREFGRLEPRWLPTADGSDCVVAFRAAALARG